MKSVFKIPKVSKIENEKNVLEIVGFFLFLFPLALGSFTAIDDKISNAPCF